MNMQTVVTLSLNGKAFKLEEPAQARLRAYLDEAGRALGGDPDRAEILADLEQAIGEKCAKTLSAHKDVVSLAEVEQVIAEMGPVQAAEPVGPQAVPAPGRAMPKRLYQVRDGAMLTGVCNGIGVYFNLDPTIIRIAFVVLTFVTGGFWILLYLVLMLLLPAADTLERQAAAQGVVVNAQYLMDRAKSKYAELRTRRSTT